MVVSCWCCTDGCLCLFGVGLRFVTCDLWLVVVDVDVDVDVSL